jgi:hypothetical protein
MAVTLWQFSSVSTPQKPSGFQARASAFDNLCAMLFMVVGNFFGRATVLFFFGYGVFRFMTR